jgi:hypothetical protein
VLKIKILTADALFNLILFSKSLIDELYVVNIFNLGNISAIKRFLLGQAALASIPHLLKKVN